MRLWHDREPRPTDSQAGRPGSAPGIRTADLVVGDIDDEHPFVRMDTECPGAAAILLGGFVGRAQGSSPRALDRAGQTSSPRRPRCLHQRP
jgi:hypothetical protein